MVSFRRGTSAASGLENGILPANVFGWMAFDKDSERQLHQTVQAKINTTSAEVGNTQQAGIRFYPDGSSTGGSVDLTYNQQTYKVNVEWVTGRVSIQQSGFSLLEVLVALW